MLQVDDQAGDPHMYGRIWVSLEGAIGNDMKDSGLVGKERGE